jgi:hypothetical protein
MSFAREAGASSSIRCGIRESWPGGDQFDGERSASDALSALNFEFHSAVSSR